MCQETFVCAGCGEVCEHNPRVKEQEYCGRPECQQKRKDRWLKEKMRADPDYRENRINSNRTWHKNNPDYYRKYRITHMDYTKRNRRMQRKRNKKRIAKTDALRQGSSRLSGIYACTMKGGNDIAKTDTFYLELTYVSGSSAASDALIAKKYPIAQIR